MEEEEDAGGGNKKRDKNIERGVKFQIERKSGKSFFASKKIYICILEPFITSFLLLFFIFSCFHFYSVYFYI